jgi:hypothetical protein
MLASMPSFGSSTFDGCPACKNKSSDHQELLKENDSLKSRLAQSERVAARQREEMDELVSVCLLLLLLLLLLPPPVCSFGQVREVKGGGGGS